MALEAATIEGPVTAQERKPVDITPEMTAKQLAAVVEERGEDSGSLALNAAWLKAGPFSGRIIQALFCLPFKTEEVSEDPVETLATVYLKVRRHWPVYTQGCVVWLLEVMRKWWGDFRWTGCLVSHHGNRHVPTCKLPETAIGNGRVRSTFRSARLGRPGKSRSR